MKFRHNILKCMTIFLFILCFCSFIVFASNSNQIQQQQQQQQYIQNRKSNRDESKLLKLDDKSIKSNEIKRKEEETSNPLCLPNEKESAIGMFVLCLLFLIPLAFVFLILRFKVYWFPESIGVIIIGIIFGLILRYVFPEKSRTISQLDPELFFVVFLPAIIFDAGYSLDKGDFFRNIGSIILFAFVGTAISTVVVASGIYATGYFGLSLELPLIESFMYGSLISAIDPVATLAIFSALKVNPTLHYLVFGESIVNDAVAVVLFETFRKFNKGDGTSTFNLVFQGTIQFVVSSVGSVIVGILFALASALLFKFADMRKYHALEMGFFFLFAYLSYLIALPYLSGIMTVMTVGVVMSYYTTPNLSKEGAAAIGQISHTIAFISETFVFMYMGMAIFAFENLKWDLSLTVFVILFCLLGRFLNIIPLSQVVNSYRKQPISAKNQLIMWFSGLRGAIAFALAIGWKHESDIGEYFFTTTVLCVLFTIVVFGGLTYPLLRIFKVKTRHSVEVNTKAELQNKAVNRDEHLKQRADRTEYFNIITWLDENIMRKAFLRQEESENTINIDANTQVAALDNIDQMLDNDQNISIELNNIPNEDAPSPKNEVPIETKSRGISELDDDLLKIYSYLKQDPTKLSIYKEAIQKFERHQQEEQQEENDQNAFSII